MQLIGLTGRIGAGKDEIADVLVRNYNFTKMAWADPLYQEVSDAFEIPLIILHDRDTKEQPHALLTAWACKDKAFSEVLLKIVGFGAQTPAEQEAHVITREEAEEVHFSPRQILLFWGTEYRRAQDPDYWIKQMDERVTAWNKEMRRAMGQAIIDNDETYAEPGGIVIVGTRFTNEREFIDEAGGLMWHIYNDRAKIAHVHTSEIPLDIETGDKMFFNYGSLPALATGVSIALSGKDVVSTKGA